MGSQSMNGSPVAISIRAYARSRKERGLPGTTHRAVAKAIHAGRIQRREDGLIDPLQADTDWDRKASPDAMVRRKTARAGKGKLDPPVIELPKEDPDQFMSARTRREIAAARTAEMDLAERERLLIPAEPVAAEQEAAIREIRDHILLFPGRCTPALAALTGYPESQLYNALDSALRDHLEEKSRELRITPA